jgi:hypothetical protein
MNAWVKPPSISRSFFGRRSSSASKRRTLLDVSAVFDRKTKALDVSSKPCSATCSYLFMRQARLPTCTRVSSLIISLPIFGSFGQTTCICVSKSTSSYQSLLQSVQNYSSGIHTWRLGCSYLAASVCGEATPCRA